MSGGQITKTMYMTIATRRNRVNKVAASSGSERVALMDIAENGPTHKKKPRTGYNHACPERDA
jgi:hypothetical protein